ncbi:hypothetical protein [Celerinatantimonas yamalensis]|uniref:Integral membrane protein (TIGR02206 family) n=1 Tax=Celerinatantimonas yamalensis TaxID=559956 RepID=A0ABW9G8M1_9GAMM
MISKLQYPSVYLPIFIVLWLGLFIDSRSMAQVLEYNQWMTSFIVLLCFAWVYRKATSKIKKLMVYGVGLALLGEMFFSLVLGMYEYRLANVPIYVPLGHSLVYAAVFYLCKERVVQRNKILISRVLFGAMILYATLWLVLDDDLFGFVCTLFVMYFLKKKRGNTLFFLVMYFMVVYLELLGTHYNCWMWPETWFSRISFITSSNPPSGISVFYFGFDIGCLWVYKQMNLKKWNRMKAIRELKRLS